MYEAHRTACLETRESVVEPSISGLEGLHDINSQRKGEQLLLVTCSVFIKVLFEPSIYYRYDILYKET